MSLISIKPRRAPQKVTDLSLYDLCHEYVKTWESIKRRENKLEKLKEPIIEHLKVRGDIEHKGYLLKLNKKETYLYSDETKQLFAKFKEMADLERTNGTAQVAQTTFCVKVEKVKI